MSQELTMRAVCPHDCPDTCSMLVRVSQGQVLAVRGDRDQDFTRGFLCHKVARYQERVHHPDRLRTPLRRVGQKGAGLFEPVSWDVALDEIVRRWREIASGTDGPQAILPYSYCGTMGRIQGESLDRRFFHVLGASRLDRTICATAGMAGYQRTVGSGAGMDPEGFSESRLIINWGSNTAVTNMHLWVRMHHARKLGARIVTIDPYCSRTAERSDEHLMPRVGTDAALALGLMHVIFRENLQDDDYLNRYCLGADELRERVLCDYDVDRVSRITGISPSTIDRLAHEYATRRPASIRANYGLQRHRGGGMALRTVSCLPAIVGAWRQAGGGILLSTSARFPLNVLGLQRPDLSPKGTRVVNMVQLAEALSGELSGPPVKAIYIYNSNPAAAAPDQRRVIQGLERTDLFTVVHDQFLTDSADYADIVLPATTQLEHFDLHSAYGHHWLQVNQPAIPPLYESRSNTDVFRELAARFEFEPAVFQVSDRDLAREALWESSPNRPEALDGITVDALISGGPQKLRGINRAPFAAGGFETSSGKCELYSTRAEAEGTDPLPHYIAPHESPDSNPELARDFPLQLLSPPSANFLNSTFNNVDSLRAAEGHPRLEMHTVDARNRGIAHGEMVRIWNKRGAFQARASVEDRVRTGVVVAPGIWWNKLSSDISNANVTTSSALTDVGGGATFFDNLVEVQPTIVDEST
ncbi:MAG: molybdopterin oxidoreductase family protein [Planctomycetaceae bacterium]